MGRAGGEAGNIGCEDVMTHELIFCYSYFLSTYINGYIFANNKHEDFGTSSCL
jgi:hypothetical protein